MSQILRKNEKKIAKRFALSSQRAKGKPRMKVAFVENSTVSIGDSLLYSVAPETIKTTGKKLNLPDVDCNPLPKEESRFPRKKLPSNAVSSVPGFNATMTNRKDPH